MRNPKDRANITQKSEEANVNEKKNLRTYGECKIIYLQSIHDTS